MTIRPVDFATIQRTDDVGMMKHQQDAKPVVEQQNIQVEIKKQEYHDDYTGEAVQDHRLYSGRCCIVQITAVGTCAGGRYCFRPI